jgi:hypothetical protein
LTYTGCILYIYTMIKQKEDLFNALCTAIIVVLMLFVFSAWSDHPVKENESTSAIELQLVFQIHQRNALDSPVEQLLFSPERIQISFNGFNNGNLQAVADHEKISHCIFVLQKAQLPVIAENACRFYYHLFPKDAEDIPDLS